MTAFIVVMIVLVLVLFYSLNHLSDKKQIEKWLEKNIESIYCIVETLRDIEYDTIKIRRSENDDYRFIAVHKDRNVMLENSEVIDIVYSLFDSKGLREITKESNYLKFQLWITLDEERGFLYLLEGEEPIILYNNIEVFEWEPFLKFQNYYYYRFR